MAEPESDYEKLRRAERALGGRREYVVRPVEEDEQVAAAAADEAPAPELTLEWRQPSPPESPPPGQGVRGKPWQSPITPANVAQVIGLHAVAVEADGGVWWRDIRPDDGGYRLIRRDPRLGQAELRGIEPVEAIPVPGGAAAIDGLDGRLWLLRHEQQPIPLTEEPVDRIGERYTDPVLSPDGREVWCVREYRHGGAAEWSLVTVPLDGGRTVRVHVSGTTPLSGPRPSPDGTLLAWVEWDHPQMPWDGSRLRVGRLDTHGGVGQAWTILGGPTESVCQPEWASPASLYVVSDRTRWWNLYEVWLDGTLRPLYLSAQEFGWPQYAPGLATYGLLADGRLAVLHGCGDWRLDLLDPDDGTLVPLQLPYTGWQPTLRTAGTMIAGVAGAPALAPSVVVVDAASGRHQVVQHSVDEPAAGYLPDCRPTAFTSGDGHDVHVAVYPPRNPRHRYAPGERVPYLLLLPDGPGAQSTRMFDPVKALFTSRGYGVATLDPRGSSGYGRGYREQIFGRWGVADVEDCAVAARGLVQRWGADPDAIILRGRAAGATLALEALANTDLFAAATVYAPITDLTGLPTTTGDHLQAIAADSALTRSASWLGHISRPVLMLHGERDTEIPVNQTTLLRDELRRHGVPHTCLTFPGEGHRIRQADNIRHALETELSFYADVMQHLVGKHAYAETSGHGPGSTGWP